MGFWSDLFGKKEEKNTEEVVESPQENTEAQEEATPEVEETQEEQVQ